MTSKLEELLGESFLNKRETRVQVKDISEDGLVIGLYFSAHWCPPCRMFTPTLKKFYENMKSTGKKFEVIFLSMDSDEEEYEEYIKDMPWLLAPFGKLTDDLSKKYDVNGIPTLILIDSITCDVITEHGRAKVTNDPHGSNFPWKNTT